MTTLTIADLDVFGSQMVIIYAYFAISSLDDILKCKNDSQSMSSQWQ